LEAGGGVLSVGHAYTACPIGAIKEALPDSTRLSSEWMGMNSVLLAGVPVRGSEVGARAGFPCQWFLPVLVFLAMA
jgi:hypothetical protein